MPGHLLGTSKTLVLLVSLVPVAVLLRLQLGTQLLKDGLKQLLLADLVVSIASPDGDLNGIPADGVGDTADVVIEGCSTVSLIPFTSYIDVLTRSFRLHGALENVTDSQKTNLVPELRRLLLADSEVPCATTCVARILPQRLYAKVEQVDAVPQLQALYRDVVEVLVEVLHAHNLVAKRLWAVGVFFGSGGGGGRLRRRLLLALLGPELPAVLELGDTHGFEDGIEHGGAASWRRGCGCLRRAWCREVRGGQCWKAAGHLEVGGSVDCALVEESDHEVEARLEVLAERSVGWWWKRLAVCDELESLGECARDCDQSGGLRHDGCGRGIK